MAGLPCGSNADCGPTLACVGGFCESDRKWCGDSIVNNDEECDNGVGTCEGAGCVDLDELSFGVYAGGAHTCALVGSYVRCWGLGSSGQLGHMNTKSVGDDEEPTYINDVDVGAEVEQLALGESHTCALLKDGQGVKCWGLGAEGQLGYGDTENVGDDEAPADREPFLASENGTSVTQLVAGGAHTCALLEQQAGTGGEVKCWGLGAEGQLGYGDTKSISDPTNEPFVTFAGSNGAKVKMVTAGGAHTCALMDDDTTVYCWGRGEDGQLSNQSGDQTVSPAVASVFSGTPEPIAQLVAGAIHTCVLLETGSAYCWGRSHNGQTGSQAIHNIGDDADEYPELVEGLSGIVQLAAGGYHTCALSEDGSIYCWGWAIHGQLGNGDTKDIGNEEGEPPVRVDVGRGSIGVTTGTTHTCALMEGGLIRCWGRGTDGRLGYGNTDSIGDDEIPASGRDVPYVQDFGLI